MFERFSYPFRAPAPRPIVPAHDRALAPDPAPLAPDPAAAAVPAMVMAPVATPLARASDPRGVRVVPLRPSSPWPLRRSQERVLNPFRAFPFRAIHLSRLMYANKTD
jgi:hypothetical protein